MAKKKQPSDPVPDSLVLEGEDLATVEALAAAFGTDVEGVVAIALEELHNAMPMLEALGPGGLEGLLALSGIKVQPIAQTPTVRPSIAKKQGATRKSKATTRKKQKIP